MAPISIDSHTCLSSVDHPALGCKTINLYLLPVPLSRVAKNSAANKSGDM
jgi:hypothetical protein